jgi:hypothetical protein
MSKELSMFDDYRNPTCSTCLFEFVVRTAHLVSERAYSAHDVLQIRG